MTLAEGVEDDGPEAWWTRPIVLAIGLSVALLLALAASERSTGFTVDEGSYAIQAEAVDKGSWAIDWPFREADPTARHFPYHGGSVSDTEEFAYVSHPAWPALLSVARDLGGEEVGLRALSLASVVASAVVGFHLAHALGGRRAGPWGFLLVLSTPVLANGFMTWAHAASTACAGAAVLAGVRIVQRTTSPGWFMVLASALGGGVLLRSEGLLFAAAACLGLALMAWIGDRTDRPRALLAASVGGLAAVAALAFERAWTADIVGDDVSSGVTSRAGGSGSWIGGRLSGIGTSLFDGATASGGAGLLSGLALCAVAVTVFSLLRPDRRVRSDIALVAGTVAGAARIVVGRDDPVPGLLAAAPVLLLAVVPIVRSTIGSSDAVGGRVRGAQYAAITAIVFAVAVMATQYDDGGGLQWGGRYLSPLLVPAAALGAVCLGNEAFRNRLAAGAVVTLAAVSAVGSVVITDQVRTDNAAGMAAVAAAGADVVLVPDDLLARLDWAAWPERQWLTTDGDVEAAVAVLRDALVRSAAAVLIPADELQRAGADPSGSTAGPVIPVTLDREASRQVDDQANVRSQVGTDG